MSSYPNSPLVVTLTALVLMAIPSWTFAVQQQALGITCDSGALADAEAEFRHLQGLRRKGPNTVSESEFRAASIDYVRLAEACYQAMHGPVPANRKFDDGGLWADRTDSNKGYRTAAVPPKTDDPKGYNLFGTKWGADSPYFTPVGTHVDSQGPRSPGGVVTYSFMANGVNLTAEGTGTNTAIGSLATFESCFYQEISDAFAAWSAIADIQFLPVTDNGLPFDSPGALGDIRIGAHYIDGVDGVIAHAYYPPPNGFSAAGDLHFDTSETWACDPAQLTGWEVDIGLVALHEIGHSLGLGHEATDPAVMEPAYNPSLNFGPVADDIIGIAEIYGGSPLGSGYFGGELGVGTDEPMASLHVLKTDGTARVLVEETGTAANRALMELKNNGSSFFKFTNTFNGQQWTLNPLGTSFTFDNLNFPGQEFRLYNTGRLVITPSSLGSASFDLLTNGDLTIAGNMAATDYFYTSDKNRKTDFQEVDITEILEKVARLPVTTWRLKESGTSHIGPMGQDFHDLFGVGIDERHLSPTDTAGVALAAIQGLFSILQERNREMEVLKAEKDAEIAALKAEIAEIRAMLGDR